MRRIIAAFLLASSVFLNSCTRSAPPPRSAQNTTRITGTLVDKLDGAPYTYLLNKTDKGEVWAAVPIASVEKDRPVTVVNGVLVKGFEAKPLRKKFEVVGEDPTPYPVPGYTRNRQPVGPPPATAPALLLLFFLGILVFA